MKTMTRPPTHPGTIIREDYLVPLGVTIKDLAHTLGIPRKTLSKIVNQRGAITPDKASRLSRALDTTPDFWLNLQGHYDLWQAQTASDEWQKVEPFPEHVLHDNSSSCCGQTVED